VLWDLLMQNKGMRRKLVVVVHRMLDLMTIIGKSSDNCVQLNELHGTLDRKRKWSKTGSLSLLISDLNSPAVQAWQLHRRQHFSLLRQKRTDFWTACVTADQQCLWQSLDQLMDVDVRLHPP